MRRCTRCCPFLLAGALLIGSMAAHSDEAGQGMRITGDQELPKVLYLVPWKEPRRLVVDMPELDNPYLHPVSPCDLSPSALAREEQSGWNCRPIVNQKR